MDLDLKKTADIEKWMLSKNIIHHYQIDEILELYNSESTNILEDGRYILYSLIQNYKSKLYTTTLPDKYERLIGPISISYMKSTIYNKYILLLGDTHAPVNPLCYRALKSIAIENWISQILSTNTKLIDVFVESGKQFEVKDDKGLSINKFQHSLESCFTSRKCSSRIHWVDVRKNLEELNHISNFLLDYNNNEKLEKVIAILRNLNLKDILEKSKIKKQFEGNKEIYSKYLEINIKFFEDDYKNNIILNLENVSTKNIGILSLLEMMNFLMNFYTIGRIFKKVICKGYCPDPTFIICYFGKNHIDDIKSFLKEIMFEEVFNIDNSNISILAKNVLNISNLPQPIFSDVN